MRDEEIKLDLWWNWKFNRTLEEPRCKEQCRFKVKLSEYLMNLHKN
jgi:hypothetical protein